MREPLEYKIDIGEVKLCVYEWSGEGSPVLLLHANGFHSRCWNEVVLRLPGRHVFAVDIHLHGRSTQAVGSVNWQLFAEDIGLLIERLDLQDIVGAGHSMGGHLLARVAASRPQRFKQLLLIDPVILSREGYEKQADVLAGFDARDHPIARRKNNWHDAREMFERFRDRAPFDSWKPEVLRDYCDYALLPPNEDGYRQLACNPINEASNYLHTPGENEILDLLPEITMPVTLLRAPGGDMISTNFADSPTWPGLAAALPDCREIYLPELNHFIPMQDPALVAAYINEALEAA